MRLIATLIVAGLAACSAGSIGASADGHPLAGTLWDVAAGERVERAALAARLREADVAILGEVHDNPAHHRRQAWLVERIAPAGIAFEMIPEASEEGVRTFLEEGGAPGEIGPAIGWERLGWPDWAMYRPVFEAAAGAYVAGGGVARGDLGRAMEADAAAAFGPGAGAYGLDEALPEAERAAVTDEMVASHCDALPRSVAAKMVAAQRLRDARFAHAVRRARAMGEGRTVLVTGNGHARTDRGVPAALAEAEPALDVVALGQLEVAEGRTALADYGPEGAPPPYDYVWFAEPAEREDPCAAFE
jgi:uncharacterized iron-regulated protein